jgi:hypothetical protein
MKESTIQSKVVGINSVTNQINFGNSRVNLIQNIQPANNIVGPALNNNIVVNGTVRPTAQTTKTIHQSGQMVSLVPVQQVQQQRVMIVQQPQQIIQNNQSNQSVPIVERIPLNAHLNQNKVAFNQTRTQVYHT